MASERGDGLQALLEYLKSTRGFDFTGYKAASIERRLAKRLDTLGLGSYGDYLDYLEVHPDEFAVLFNTILISTYLRPKIAAAKAHVLNFYWMFFALVTGVYTFGLMGIIIGPVLIAVLKAVLDTLTLDLGFPEDEPLASTAHE